MADDLTEWELIQDKGIWNAYIEGLHKGLHKGAKIPIELWGDTQPQHFPCLVRIFRSGSTGGVLNVCVAVLDNLELAGELLKLALKEKGQGLALITFTEGPGPIELTITGNISLSLE